MTDFFISYTSVDEQWAEWIAFFLEENGFTTNIQAWDFRPGSNFVIEMQRAAEAADRTLMVLSPDYLKSVFTLPEWTAAFANDPRSLERKLLPVIVRECHPEGLLRPLVHIKLAGLTEQDTRAQLLTGVKPDRAKPTEAPPFPGQSSNAPNAAFPGPPPSRYPAPYVPKIRKYSTDVEKRRFVKAAFQTIRKYFEHALKEIVDPKRGVETEFSDITNVEFTAEIFLHGRSISSCHIGESIYVSPENCISYSEGRISGAYNELLSVDDDDGEPVLRATMGDFATIQNIENLDLKKLLPDQAADYFWRRLVSRMEQR